MTETATKPRVVGIKFRQSGKLYHFNAGELDLLVGDPCIVETERGLEYGFVAVEPSMIGKVDQRRPLRRALRKATREDDERYRKKKERERYAYTVCQTKTKEFKLPMKLVAVDYTFDGKKAVFYFTAEGRVDFRELVRDLAHEFHTRIEMRQIGVRDEAKLLGGFGSCGKPLCCATFLREFEPVSIRMAKKQNLSLNPSKISGICGRLMCCLTYEIRK
jgi:cell fate regulator YaaT (PSP1 superfamily)